MKDIVVSVPEWLAVELAKLAKEYGISLNEIAVYFFAKEVVHT